MARNADVDERTRTRGQALTALGCLRKLADKDDTRAQQALQAWENANRQKPGVTPTKRSSSSHVKKT